MKTGRPLAALALALVAVPLAFPFRVAVVHQPDGIVEVPMGACFIGTNPSDLAVLSAVMKKPIERVDQVQNAHLAISRIDYGRSSMAFLAALVITSMILLFSKRNGPSAGAEAIRLPAE